MNLIFVLFGACAGAIATWLMDQVAFFMVRRGWIHLGGLRIVPPLLGRWFFLFRKERRLFFPDLRERSAIEGEERAGLILHFAIGIFLGIVYAIWKIFGPTQDFEFTLPTMFYEGAAFGFATNAFPWLLMYPAMGLGFFASKLSVRASLLRFSFINHLVYGVGLAVVYGGLVKLLS